jgi:hypothetical protein
VQLKLVTAAMVPPEKHYLSSLDKRSCFIDPSAGCHHAFFSSSISEVVMLEFGLKHLMATSSSRTFSGRIILCVDVQPSAKFLILANCST